MCSNCTNGPTDFEDTDKGLFCSLCFDIREFHQKFGIPSHSQPNGLVGEMATFRKNRLREELDEYAEALDEMDAEKQLDALVDLVYIAVGTAYISGFRFAEAWDRVHSANMEKVRAEKPEQSKHNTAFDIIKPEGWTAPTLRDISLTPHRVFTDNPEVFLDVDAISPRDAMLQAEASFEPSRIEYAVRL